MQGQSGNSKDKFRKRSAKEEAEHEEPLGNEIQFKGITRKPEQMKADAAADREGERAVERDMHMERKGEEMDAVAEP